MRDVESPQKGILINWRTFERCGVFAKGTLIKWRTFERCGVSANGTLMNWRTFDSCGVSLKVTLMFNVRMEQGDFDPWKICPRVVGRWVG